MKKVDGFFLADVIFGCFLAILFVGMSALGQAADPIAVPTYFDSILKSLANSSVALASLIAGAEILFRVIPTAKPLSVLVPFQYAFAGIAAIAKFLADAADALIKAYNNTK